MSCKNTFILMCALYFYALNKRSPLIIFDYFCSVKDYCIMSGLSFCDGMSIIFCVWFISLSRGYFCVWCYIYFIPFKARFYIMLFFSQIIVYSLLLIKSTCDLFANFWNLNIYIFISRKCRWINIIQMISILFLSTNRLLKLTLANVKHKTTAKR